MKRMTPMLKTLALLVSVLTLTSQLGLGATKIWTNSASDMLWSTTGNWTANGKPGTGDTVLFTNLATTGTSGALGASNNIVDAGFANSINNLQYMNTNGFHNTRVTNTLFIKGIAAGSSSTLTSSGNAIAVGSGSADDGATTKVYATIQGGSLNVSNRTGYMVIRQWSATGGAHAATLDLSGLDNFTATLADIYIGYDSAGTYTRPGGVLILARTNNITLVDTGTDYHLGYAYLAASSTPVSNRLGQVNFFNVDQMRFGGPKCSVGAYFDFNAGLVSPSVKFRGTNSIDRQTAWAIGDNSPLSGSGSTASLGYVDFTRGSVDALVDTIYAGRGGSGSYGGVATGTLTFGGGSTNLSTINVNTLEIGYQVNTAAIGSGTVNVQSNGTLVVNKDVRLALLNAGTQIPSGTLNINGGKVTVAGNVVAGGGTSTLTITNNGSLDLKPAGDTVAGNISVNTLNVGVANITNYNTLTVSNITVRAPATTFTVYTGEALAPAGVGVGTTLPVTGNLTLTNATLKLDIGSPSDQVTVSGALEIDGTNTVLISPIAGFVAGSYPVMTYGTSFTGDPTNNLVAVSSNPGIRYNFSFDTNTANTLMLNVGGAPASLTWSGDGAGNVWNLTSATNWNASTEMFYNLDNVTFDDSGSTNPTVNLVGTLTPGSVTVGGTTAYTFAGTGKLSGPNGLVDNSTGTLTILTTNNYSGLTFIGGGATLQFGDGTTANGGSVGTGEVQNNSTLILKPLSYQTIAGVVSGGGALTKTGPGITVLYGTNTFSSPLTIEAGTLRAGSTAALGDINVATTITNTGTLDIGGFNLGSEPIIVSGAGVSGAGAIVNSGATQGNALNNVTLAGDTVFGGPNRWDLSGLSQSSTEPGLRANGYKLTKVGTNQVSITSYNTNWVWNTDVGDIDVQAGILSIQAYVTLGANTNTMTIRSNAAVEFCHTGPMLTDKPISMTNGCIQARYFGSGYPPYVDLSGPITLNGSNVFDVFATTMNMIVDGEIGGSGSLVKGIGGHAEGGNVSTGVGTLVLMASNSFTGDLRVQTGSLVLSNTASVTKAANIVMAGGTLNAGLRTDGTLTLASGQNLKGNGTILGIVNSPVNTTVAPGSSSTAATLTVGDSTTLRGTTLMDISKTNTTLAADKIVVTNSLDLGGTLTVSLTSNTNLVTGDKFTLFSATGGYLHGFTTVNLPAISGLVWTNMTAIDGTIQVLYAEPSVRPTLTNTVVGNQLTLAWPTNYLSYVLKGQTNPVTVGLLNDPAAWGAVPGVSGNQVTLPIDPANGTVFFRLLKQ